MKIDKQLSFPSQGTLAAGAKKRFRICPWDSTNTHIPTGSKVKVQVDVRSQSIGTFAARLFDCYQTTGPGGRLPFNPSGPMRALDRNSPDNLLLVDDNTDLDPAALGGALLWNEMGTVDEVNSPVIMSRPTPPDAMSFPGSNDYEFVLEIENLEGVELSYTVEIYAEIV
jgi:hypothetical protein